MSIGWGNDCTYLQLLLPHVMLEGKMFASDARDQKFESLLWLILNRFNVLLPIGSGQLDVRGF